MRAHTKKCLLLLAIWACLHSSAYGQFSRFFQRSSAPRQTYLPNANATAPVGSQVSSVRAQAHARTHAADSVRTVQHNVPVASPIVPSALDEAALPVMEGLPVTEPAPEMGVLSEYPPASGSDLGPLDLSSPPIGNSKGMAPEMVVDTGYGLPYDMPLDTVIPQQAVETYSTSDWFRNGNWYSRQEFVMLLRADLPLQHLAVDGSAVNASFDPNLTPSLSTKHADFTFEAGTRLSIGHRLGRDPANRDHALEFVFLGLLEYSGRATLSAQRPTVGGIVSLIGSEESVFTVINRNPGFSSVNFIGGFDANTEVDIVHKADFNSLEFNYVIGARPAKDRLVLQPDGRWVRHATPSKVRGLFAGVRYIRQNDLFQYRGVGEVSATGIDSDVGGQYQVTTDNDLIGVQIGGDFTRKRTDWLLGIRSKVGGLINFADRTNRLSLTTASTDVDGNRTLTTTNTELHLQDETLTFVGEVGAYVAYYVRPNTALRMGYDVLYMNGMATATNNLGIRGDGTTFARFETTGDSFYHGLNLGFEMTW